jgi:hypothetical protein
VEELRRDDQCLLFSLHDHGVLKWEDGKMGGVEQSRAKARCALGLLLLGL